jgi:hypothetical protein
MPAYFGEVSSNIGDRFGQHRIIGTDDLDMSKSAVIGNTFLSDSWHLGTLYLTHNRQLESPSFKYDLENNQFLLNAKETPTEKHVSEDVRILHGTHVMAFEMTDPLRGKRQFLNSVNANMTSAGKPLLGFLEILTDGELVLYRKVETKLLKSNYNVALNAGDRNDRIIRKEIYYIGRSDSMDLQEIGKNKNANLAIFAHNQQKIKEFMKQNNLKFTDQSDLVQLVTFHNSL